MGGGGLETYTRSGASRCGFCIPVEAERVSVNLKTSGHFWIRSRVRRKQLETVYRLPIDLDAQA